MTSKTYWRTPIGTSLANRLAARSAPGDGGCLLWTGSVGRRGYGQIRVGATMVRTHRLAWTLAKGVIPADLLVLHRCDVRTCINPAHLFLGTSADNSADMVAKGRSGAGENHSKAKLTRESVLAIATRLSAGETCASIAREFGVGPTTVINIKTGYRWSRLTGR